MILRLVARCQRSGVGRWASLTPKTDRDRHEGGLDPTAEEIGRVSEWYHAGSPSVSARGLRAGADLTPSLQI